VPDLVHHHDEARQHEQRGCNRIAERAEGSLGARVAPAQDEQRKHGDA
jgi:hypothetical protein